jgi:DNA polymerase/3'-5' exonuclease PolX
MAKKTETANQFRFVFCIPAHAMPIHNDDIAKVFEEIADLLDIRGENRFRIRAYRNAAREVRSLRRELAGMVEEGADLTGLPGIGEALAGKIQEVVRTGTCQTLKKLEKQLPPDLTELLHLPGLGPKRVHALHYDLDIHTPEQLYRAAKDGRLRELPGFGPKTEAAIVSALEAHLSAARRFKLATAARYAEPLAAWLESTEGVDRVVVAGSYRRSRETVGDLDILVTAADAEPVMKRSDLRGDLHCHTVATDGHGTLEEMARAAQEQGLEYLAITEHSKRLTMVHGLDSRGLLRQMDHYPLMHTSGSSRATLRARPAASAASTTALTSL